MNTKFLILFYIFFTSLFLACSGIVEDKSKEQNILTGEWVLVSFDTLGKPTYNLPPEDTIIMFIQKDGRLNGISSGLCINSFGGT